MSSHRFHQWLSPMIPGCTILLFLIAVCAPLDGQEVKYIDLTAVQQRVELHHPAAPPAQCQAECVGGGFGSTGVADGAPDPRDPRGLGIYVLRVSPTEIDPHQPFEAEFRVVNTGRVKIDVPVSPHLSDLQPDDASLSFSYFSLSLLTALMVEPYAEMRSIGLVELYGSPDREGTMVTLEPGEWIRVQGNVRLAIYPLKSAPGRIYGKLWFRKNTFHPHPGGSSTEIQNLYPNVTQMSPETWLPVYFRSTQLSTEGKQHSCSDRACRQ